MRRLFGQRNKFLMVVDRQLELEYDIHEVAQFSLHSSWEDLKRYTHLRPENLRQVIVKPSGEIEVITPPIKITTLQCPPPEGPHYRGARLRSLSINSAKSAALTSQGAFCEPRRKTRQGSKPIGGPLLH